MMIEVINEKATWQDYIFKLHAISTDVSRHHSFDHVNPNITEEQHNHTKMLLQTISNLLYQIGMAIEKAEKETIE